MASSRPPVATTVPPTLEKRLEIMQAIRALAAQKHEQLRRRRAEIAALRRGLEEMALALQDVRRQCDPRLRSYVLKYNPDQPRVPAGRPGGGQWTSEGGSDPSNGGQAVAGVEPQGTSPGRPQYAALQTATVTDASVGGEPPKTSQAQSDGTAEHAEKPTAQYAENFLSRLQDLIQGKYNTISAGDIPPDDPHRPVAFVDSAGNPITDDQGNPLLRPANLPPEIYVIEGQASHLGELFGMYNNEQIRQTNPELAIPLLTQIGLELAPLKQGGRLDAQRFDANFVVDYRDYANIGVGIFLAAGNAELDDGLKLADSYAQYFSTFREPMDDVYVHLAKRDVHDITLGYDLYKSGRISSDN